MVKSKIEILSDQVIDDEKVGFVCILKLIRVLRRIVNEENEISKELKKYHEEVVGNMEVIEVLYRAQ